MKTNVARDSIEIRCDGGEFVCDWGAFDNPEANPHARSGIQPLILAEPAYVARLLLEGPLPGPCGGMHNAFIHDDGRKFVRVEWEGRSWTWEMFKAHWWDGDPFEIMVGRWSD